MLGETSAFKGTSMLVALIGRENLQNLQGNIATASKSAVLFVDTNGNTVTELSTYNKRSQEIYNKYAVNQKSLETMKRLRLACQETEIPEIFIDVENDYTFAAVPVMVDQEFFGVWAIFTDIIVRDQIDSVLYFMMTMTSAQLKTAAISSDGQKNLYKPEEGLFTLQSFVNSLDDTFTYVCDYETCELLMCNNTYASYFYTTPENMVGTYCYQNLGYTERCSFCPYKKIVGKDGEFLPTYSWENYLEPMGLWVNCSNHAARWADGRIVHVVNCIDITQRKRLEEEVNLLAFRDHKLHVPNTAALELDLNKCHGGGFLVVLDVEGLRKINDVYGRINGDNLLKSVGEYIAGLQIPNSSLYRLEIADFGIFIKGDKENIELISALVDSMHKRCEQAWHLKMDEQIHDIFITINICVVPINENEGASFHNMYGFIEHTLEIARKTNGVAIYNDETEEQLRAKLKLEISLKNAVKDNMNGFSVLYQPIVEPGVAMWTGMEVLCRWRNDEFGAVLPSEFIPVAESSGLISRIGMWVMEQSVMQVKKWGLDKVERFLLEVNLSPIQLAIPNLDQLIVTILNKYDYPPEKLCLEVTESNELNFSRHTMEAIERLSEIGVCIALDDFGTGYASLHTLHKLPVKILKTERAFINGLENDEYLQRLYHIIAELAHSSGKKIVAEGVETDFQAQFLLKQGTDFFQGYLFSKPIPAEELEKKLDNYFSVSPQLVAMGYVKFDLANLIGEKGEYNLSPSLFRILNRCMTELFQNEDSAQAIDIALEHIGKGLGVSRSYLFVRQTGCNYSNVNEWCAQGVESLKDDLQDLPLEEMYPEWIEAFYEDGMLVVSNVGNLSPERYEALRSHKIKSLVEFPFWKDGELFGFVGFDDCVRTRLWTKEEVQMLHTLTGIIASTIAKGWMRNRIDELVMVRESVLNHMDTLIYVSDLETNKVLFANSEAKRLYGVDNIEGQICWKVLRGIEEPCEFCPIPQMLENPDKSYQWEFYNEVLGKHFRIMDCLIPWTDNKLVHLEYAEDITKLKNYQDKLEIFASTDMLTNALNRSAFLAMLREMLDDAEDNEYPLTVVFVDIDELKTENDTFGHLAGDDLIKEVVQAVRGAIRETDILGRYGGDEFVIAMKKCQKELAETRMDSALSKLKEAGIAGMSFSYGVAQNNEVPYANTEYYLTQLIDCADRRMFAQKRMKKNKQINSERDV